MEPKRISLKAREIAAKLMEHPDDEVYVCNEDGYWNPVETVNHGPIRFCFGASDKDDERPVFSVA